jgi:hypothetical protein
MSISTNQGFEDNDDVLDGCESCGDCGTVYYTKDVGFYCDQCLRHEEDDE